MYRTGKGNFFDYPPYKIRQGDDFQTVKALTSFSTYGNFSDLPPENKRSLTDFTRILKNLAEKFHFGKNCRDKPYCTMSRHFKKACWDIRGDIRSKSDRQQRGQFLFTVSNTAVSVQKNGHSRRNAVEPHRATFYRGGYNYTPNTFEGRTAALYGRI